MNILITGGGGFIGSHLVDSQLRQGHHVRIVDVHVDRLAHVAGHPRLEVVTGSITDPELVARVMDGIDYVYHLASTHLQISVPDARYWKVNVQATETLLRAARDAGVARFVYCGSVGVFGEIANPPADESTPCHPTNIYERTKLAAEQTALTFARQSGLPIVVVRPAWVYGPRCQRTHKLFRTIAGGRFVVVGDGQSLRHPIYVSDAVKGLERCAEVDGAVGNVYIVAGPEAVTVDTLIRMVATVAGVPAPRRRIPVAPAKAAGVALELVFKPLGREPPFSRRSVDFFLKDNAYDTHRAQRELGFHPRVVLREGLERTWQSLNHYQGHRT